MNSKHTDNFENQQDLTQEPTNNEVQKEGPRQFIIGEDVILNAGEDAIRELEDSGEHKNVLYFDFDALRKHRDDRSVKQFLTQAKKSKGRVEIYHHLPKNDENYDIEVITDDPFLELDYYDKGFTNSSRPRFLIEDPQTLKQGILRTETTENYKSLKHEYSLEDAIDRFSINGDEMFINQFYIVRTPEGKEAIYQIKQDWNSNGPNKEPQIDEPYIRRLEKQIDFFSGKKNPFEKYEMDFGIFPNHMNQYLAYEYLLKDPSIELVSLTGEAGSGKTLLAYMAGLRQTLIETANESAIKKGEATSIYNCIRLIKASLGEAEYKNGYLPGDLNEKQGPLMGSYAHIHDYELNGINFSYEKAKEPQNKQFYKAAAGGGSDTMKLFAPSDRVPLVFEEAIEYIKGMTYRDSFMIVDEMQDARPRVAKSILTRIGLGSKTVMCGDPSQISTEGLSEDRNGLVYSSVNHMRQQHPFYGMMHLPVSSRSNVARASLNLPDRK